MSPVSVIILLAAVTFALVGFILILGGGICADCAAAQHWSGKKDANCRHCWENLQW